MFKKQCAVIFLLLAFVLTFTASATEQKTVTKNETGKFGEFDYEFWRDKGEAIMNLNDDGTFDCEWDKNSTGNILFRTGKKFDSTKTHSEIGDITLSYGCDYQPDGNSYLCVYGWSVDPLVEFYVIESWGDWRPPGGVSKGSVMLDDGEYEIYETTRTNMPSIQGTKTFQQYWSVRTEKSTNGSVSVSKHFNIWESMGMNLGKLYEVALCVEGYQSSGKASVYSNMLTFGDTTLGSITDPPETTTAVTEEVITEAEETPVDTEGSVIESEEVSEEFIDAIAETEENTEPVGEVIDTYVEGGAESNNLYIYIAIGAALVVIAVIAVLVKKRKK